MEAVTEDDQVMIEGRITVVAKTGGIKLDTMAENAWLNPAPHLRDRITPDLKGQYARVVLERQGSNVMVGISTDVPEGQGEISHAPSPPRQFTPRPTPPQVKRDEEGLGIELARKLGLVQNLQGREYISHAGLLAIAHRMGFVKSETNIIQVDLEKHIAIVKATVTMKENHQLKTFEGLGDSTPENTNKNIQSACLRMAETRAINRALRQATNIGLTSLEELPEKEDRG